ncbi:MAG: hypothetical protein HOQ24_03875, partial [Mycobacteriaceae bacterium]|nr:hypothetical protein [Mycobacteriaceae bacterium]
MAMFSLYGSSTWPRTLDGGWRHPGRAYRRDDEDSAAEPAADTGEQLPNDSTSSDTEASDRSGHADTSSAEPELSVAGTEPAINDGDRRTAVHDIEEQTHNRDDHIWNGTSHFTREDVDDAYDQLTHTEDGERRPARDIAEIWNHLDRHSRDKLTESDPFKDTRAGGDDADDYPDVAANRQLLLDALAAGGPFGSYGYNLDEQAGGLDVDLWVPKGASDVLRAMVLELEDAMQDSVDLFGMGKPQSAPMLADIVNNDVLEADEESWADVIENHSQLEAMVSRWEQLGRMRNLEVNRTEI